MADIRSQPTHAQYALQALVRLLAIRGRVALLVRLAAKLARKREHFVSLATRALRSTMVHVTLVPLAQIMPWLVIAVHALLSLRPAAFLNSRRRHPQRPQIVSARLVMLLALRAREAPLPPAHRVQLEMR